MKASLEMLSQHAIHVDKNAHDFGNIRLRTAHSPRYPGRIIRWLQCEFVNVVGFKWFYKIDPHPDLERSRRLGNFHASAASVTFAYPFRKGALAAHHSAERSFHRGIHLVLGCPSLPVMEIVDQRKDSLRRSLDVCDALNV